MPVETISPPVAASGPETISPAPPPVALPKATPTGGVLDVWSHVEPRFGGVGPAASALAGAVEKCGIRVSQIAICDHAETSFADGIDPRVRQIHASGLRGLSDFQLAKALEPLVSQSDVCHVHGLWLPHSLAVRSIANKMGKPVVSSVHGMLEEWEMQQKWLKKATYSWLLERPSLERSNCLRALSEREVADYRRFGSRVPIAVVPNGIGPMERSDPALFLKRHPELTGKSIVLFLGRVHHKKGVFNLLRAWKTVAERRDDAHLVIAGPSYGNTGEKAKRLIDELQLEREVTLTGVISGPIKLAALSSAKYFCLPSFSEGMSVAVLEALSIGLPPVITPACNLPAVAARGAGHITSNEPAALADALISCLNANPGQWREMSDAAQELARTDFDWNKIAVTMHSVYQWLRGGNKPACVQA